MSCKAYRNYGVHPSQSGLFTHLFEDTSFAPQTNLIHSTRRHNLTTLWVNPDYLVKKRRGYVPA